MGGRGGGRIPGAPAARRPERPAVPASPDGSAEREAVAGPRAEPVSADAGRQDARPGAPQARGQPGAAARAAAARVVGALSTGRTIGRAGGA